MRRFGLRDDQWERIKDLLPGREGSVGVTAADNETVQNLGVLTQRAGTDGGPTARRQRDPAQASRWRSRSEPSASNERLVVTSACVAVRSFAGATATARYFP
jgi:transposase